MNTKLICMFCFILLISLATLPINNSSSNSDSALDSSRENDSQPLIDSIDRVPVTTFTQSSSTVELTWTSRDDDVRRIFVPPVASGDHVILHVDAYDQLIQTSLLDFTPSFSQTNILEIPSEGYNPYFDFDMSPDDGELSWFSFYGLQRGQLVTIVGLFSNSDCDFMAWTGGTDPMSYVDNIIGALMTTTSNPEGVCFEWDFNSQELIIACYNCDGETGWVELNVFVDSTADVVAAGNYIAYDTYEFQENVTVPLLYLGLTDGILMESVFHPALTFNNYFTPNITQFPPIGLGAKQFNFTWTCSDHNQDDVNYYSVWLSSDSGFTYQLLAGNLTDTFFVWDSTGFMIRENYLVKIRAYSLDFTYRDYCRVDNPPASYWPGDFSDSESFEIDAGDVHSIPPGYYEILFDSPDDVSYNSLMVIS